VPLLSTRSAATSPAPEYDEVTRACRTSACARLASLGRAIVDSAVTPPQVSAVDVIWTSSAPPRSNATPSLRVPVIDQRTRA